MDTDKKFKKLDVVQFSKVHGFAGCFEASVTTGAGITEAIQFLVQKVRMFPSTYMPVILILLSKYHTIF